MTFLPLHSNDPVYIGPWRLAGRLGSGNIGVVYGATDDTGRSAAVKTLKTDLAARPALRRRIAEEVEVLRLVDFDGVATLLDFDLAGEVPYLATELVLGQTVRSSIDEHGPLDEAGATAFGFELARILSDVHATGIVHRDVKPANVMVVGGRPVLIDFGIATLLDADDATRLGSTVGSPGWLAPEQVRGRPVTPAVDMFAWAGLVVYVSSGQSAFGSGRPEALLYRIVHEEPRLRDLPPMLSDLVVACLAKNPDDRPTSTDIMQTLDRPQVAAA